MKKELLKILDSEDATFRLNNISYLHRWTKDALGKDVDRLELEFDHINGACFSLYDRNIKSRDYDGIIRESQEITQAFFTKVSHRLCSNLRAGYRNV